MSESIRRIEATTKPTKGGRIMRTSIFETLNVLKIGYNILTEFNREMNNRNWTYEDFKEMQNNYEKLLREFCIISYGFGKLGKSEEEFIKWVNEISAYEENAENINQLNQPKTKGCGKKFNDFIFGERICGRFEDLKHSDHIILCPDCKKENSKR
jgi:hypothetical protein